MNSKELALMKKAIVFVDDHIAIKPICDIIGIDYPKALSVVKSDTKLSQLCSKQNTTGADGKQYMMYCLPKRGVLMWIYRIQSSRIKNPKVRENLMVMQDLIYDYISQKEKQAEAYEAHILKIRNIHNRKVELKNTLAACGRELKDLYKEEKLLMAADPNQMQLPFEQSKPALEYKPV